MIKKIADLVNDKVLTEVSDLADHSDRTGMRIQIELKRDAVPQVALNKLFKHTPLQTTFGFNAVALVDGVPRCSRCATCCSTTSTSSAGHRAGRSSNCARRKPALMFSRAT